MLPASLTVNYEPHPINVDSPIPKLSWKLESGESAQYQTAYRIQAATEPSLLSLEQPDLWDSGRIDSSESIHVPYGGSKLISGQRCFWRVRVWDKLDRPSAWSDVGYWAMGLLERSAWGGEWIGRVISPEEAYPSVTYLRKSFATDRPIRQATVYASALGLYRLRLNGEPVGGDRFAPGWTDYHTRTQYQAYDITSMLAEGDNTIGVLLGTGWYAGTVGMMGRRVYGTSPQLLVQLNVEYTDGSRHSIVTDGSWRLNTGAIVYSDIIKGEKQDTRLEPQGWDRPGFHEEGWAEAHTFEFYDGLLVAQQEPPIQVVEALSPVSVHAAGANRWVYDLGQNIAGWTRLRVAGAEGQVVTVRHAEMLNADGTLYTANLRKAIQDDIFILRGEEVEWLEPEFTYHGFRYVEVEGLPDALPADHLLGQAAYSANRKAGDFETSNPEINRLYANIVWGQKGNFFSVPTDCPQRDERLGWTGDAQVFVRTATYNQNVAAFFHKYMQDVIDAQREDGAFPDTAPDANWSEFKKVSSANWHAPDNAGWGDAGIIIPWTIYMMYGDKEILTKHYDAMKRWIDYCKGTSDGLIRPDYANHADWLSIRADTPKEVLATQYFAYSTRLFAEIAKVVGREEDAEAYGELFRQITQAFLNRFMNPEGIIHGDTQTVYAMALYFEMLPTEWRGKVINRLKELIRANDNHLSTGFLGVGCLLPALTEYGESELAYTLLHQETFPSWLYSVRHGATTIWERWDGWTEEGGFQSPSMNSFNHYSLGSVGEWMFRYAAGIEADPASPGFKHIKLRPCPGGKLSYVKASYESLYGRIESHWRVGPEGFALEVLIPPNTTAMVVLPAPANRTDGDGLEPGETTYRVGSGRYAFEC